ncbi:MAG TPA: hypothetical protein VFC84_05365 [Desulfosporosinus sp.]|nr:hypothetical protein [Desulfosporosinus sp.]
MDTPQSQNDTEEELEKSKTNPVYPNAQRMEKGQAIQLVHDEMAELIVSDGLCIS